MRVLPVFLIVAALGAWAAAAAAQENPVPRTAELPLHAGEGCWQFRLEVTALSDGGFAATWHENVDKLYFRRFDATGAPAGPPVLVGQGVLGSPTVLAGPGGTLRVVWSDGDSSWTRALDAAGAPLSPEPTLLGPAPGYLESAVTALGDGGFAIVTAEDALTLRRYTADGQLAGTVVLVPGGTGGGQFSAPDIAPYGRSGVAVAWSVLRDDGIFFAGRIVDFAGTSTPFETGPVLFRGSDVEGEPARPRVASGAAGTVMLSWREETVFESRILARVFGADGVPLGEAFPVDPSRLAFGFAPDLASDGAGNFLVSWLGDEEIYLRRVSSQGVPLGTTQVVATGTQRPGLEWPPVMAVTSAGRLMVAWVPDGLDEPAGPRCYSQGLFARLYDVPASAAEGDPVPLSGDLSLHGLDGCQQHSMDVTALTDGGFAATWYESFNRLVVRRFAADGSPAGPAVPVSHDVYDPPRVLAGPEGRFRVVWYDGRDLMTQAFDASGALLGPQAALFSPGPGADESAMTSLGDGGFVVVTVGGALTLWRYTADGQPAGSVVLVPGTGQTGVGLRVSAPAVAPRGRSGVVVVWSVERSGQTFFEGRIVDFSSAPVPFETGPIPSPEWEHERAPRPEVASSVAGTVLVAWQQRASFQSQILARVFGPDGVPLGQPFGIDASEPAVGFGANVVSDSAGNFLVSWVGNQILLRRVSPFGVPLGASQAVTRKTYPYGLYWPPVLAITSGDRLMVAWEPPGLYDPAGPQCYSVGLFARLYDASAGTLPLQGGRFRVSVRWTDHQGNTGEGRPVALTADSGYFWFFGPDNLELMVKVLDGRAVNGRFWFSYAALSDVAYTITVTDTATGITRAYTNPAGRLASQADTSTFADPDASASPRQASVADPQPLAETPAVGPCGAAHQPRRPGLCLGDRFEVEVVWTAPSLGTGAGQGVPLTTDSGYLWFFGANNIELVVKVLDGRPVNGHFWVFFGSLTDVEHRLTVRDTVTGAERVYTNPAGQLASRAETAAF